MATKIVTKNSSTASAVPTASDLVQGELAVNVADKRLFTEDNGGAIVEVGTNPSTLTVTGEITANGGIALGDNDKATFGAGDDLQIYHDGSDSYVKDAGAGYLNLLGTGRVVVGHPSNGDVYLNANYGGDVELFFSNSKKFETTSTGIDVTGNMIADGVGIGTSSPIADLSIGKNGNATGGNIQLGVDTNNANKYAAITTKAYASDAQTKGFINVASQAYAGNNHTFIGGGLAELDASNQIRFYTAAGVNTTGGIERMRIDSSGNLLVGTTVSPNTGDPTSVRYGIGVQAGSLSSTTPCTAGVITNVLNMANAVSGVNGAGLWLINVVRSGSSYATHFTGVFGVNSGSMALYQTIQSTGMTVSVNGLKLRLSVFTTDSYRVNAIPLSINT